MGSNGGLQSVKPGYAVVKAKYKTSAEVYMIVQVDFDLTGTWCGAAASGSVLRCYKYTFTRKAYESDIFYTWLSSDPNYVIWCHSWESSDVLSPYVAYNYYNGTFLVTDNSPAPQTCSGTCEGYSEAPEYATYDGGGSIISVGFVEEYHVSCNHGSNPLPVGGFSSIDDNSVKMGNVTLMRGENCNDCGNSNSNTGLEAVLIAKTSWTSNQCFLDDGLDGNNWHFNVDHTGTAYAWWENQTFAFSWSVNNDKDIILTNNGSNAKVVVRSYTADKVIIDHVVDEDGETTAFNCTAQWDGQ
jgi:hypothetical protein